MAFGEFSFSIEVRDVINKLVTEAIDKLRPRYRYATVNSVDLNTRKATITYNGEKNPVIVNFGSIAPSAGATVRVGGIGTDKYVEDVVGGPGITTGGSDLEVMTIMKVY